MAMAEKFAILWRAHMFKHADRHNSVEMSPHVAIIDQFEFDMIVDASRFRALAGDLELFLRQGDPQHVNAAFFVQVQGHAAPTAAYIKHSLAGFQRQLGCDMRFLVELRSEEHTSELQSLMR